MKIHHLKIDPQYYRLISYGKDFELRENDRGFQIGDIVIFEDHDDVFKITHLYEDLPGLEEGYCIFKMIPAKFIITHSIPK